jgi:hypothetical protein
LYIDSIAGQINIKMIRQELERLAKKSREPGGAGGLKALDGENTNIVERIKHSGDNRTRLAGQVLGWIIYASRPLSVLELQHALGTELETNTFDSENLTEQNLIISVCARLVSVDKECHGSRVLQADSSAMADGRTKNHQGLSHLPLLRCFRIWTLPIEQGRRKHASTLGHCTNTRP